MTRATWPEYFLDIATRVASRSTCNRLAVGAVLVKDHRIIATGYNGSLPGAPHCDDVGHLMTFDEHKVAHCSRVIHAERNIFHQLDTLFPDYSQKDMIEFLVGAELYVTHEPCRLCMEVILGYGIHPGNILFYLPYHPRGEVSGESSEPRPG